MVGESTRIISFANDKKTDAKYIRIPR